MRTRTAISMAIAIAGLASTQMWNASTYPRLNYYPTSSRITGAAKARRAAKKRRRAAA